ncbi:thermonuclease family protein [bacterium]|nr:MAG: thermonuclease family protein [bacterium]
MKIVNALMLLLFLSLNSSLFAAASKQGHYGNIIISEVTSVEKGEAFDIFINGWPEIWQKTTVLMAGIDCPNMNSRHDIVKQKAQEARAFTEKALKNAKVIELREMRRAGSPGTITGEVYVDEQNLADLLLSANLAVPYDSRGPAADWFRLLATDEEIEEYAQQTYGNYPGC